jgi:hypothetical protein
MRRPVTGMEDKRKPVIGRRGRVLGFRRQLEHVNADNRLVLVGLDVDQVHADIGIQEVAEIFDRLLGTSFRRPVPRAATKLLRMADRDQTNHGQSDTRGNNCSHDCDADVCRDVGPLSSTRCRIRLLQGSGRAFEP